jgi:hypothetical protein
MNTGSPGDGGLSFGMGIGSEARDGAGVTLGVLGQ